MIRPTRDMSERHEAFLADLFGGRMTKGSGSHWTDQMDGKQAKGSGEVVFVWDGKSTLGKGLTITMEMWAKAVEQSRPWETTMVALRWFTNDRLTHVGLDLAVVEATVLADLQRDANEVVALREEVARLREQASYEDGVRTGVEDDTYSPVGTQKWRGNR